LDKSTTTYEVLPMSMDLMDSFTSGLFDEGLIGNVEGVMNHLTGIDLVDLHNGAIDDETGEMHIGLTSGRMFTCVGQSGSGKTTLQIQAAANITKHIPNASVYHLDVERSTKKVRLKAITGYTDETMAKKYYHLDKNLYLESVKQLIDRIYNFKTENADKLMVEIQDSTGKMVKALPPTIILLDSLAVLMPKKLIDDDEMGGNMAGSSVAKGNNMMFKQVYGKMAEANIHFFVINHITTGISINPMQPVKAKINYLKQDEAVPGGSCSYYLADYYLKLNPKDKLTPDKEWGIKGFIVEVTVIKSRGFPAGTTFELVLDQAKGFDNDLSNLNALLKAGVIKGTGRGFFFEGAPDEKFSRKNFLEKLAASETLQVAYSEALGIFAENLLPRVKLEQIMQAQEMTEE
jgi:RecA/RadA recombinase